jgi:rubrerythrin
MELLSCVKAKRVHHNATQQFVVEASLLSRKWQDKVDNFQEVRKRSLELIPELGPSFEEEKEETTQDESERNSEPEGKKEQQANPETTGKVEDLTQGESRIVVRACWALHFVE